jgi:hypothetical protein
MEQLDKVPARSCIACSGRYGSNFSLRQKFPEPDDATASLRRSEYFPTRGVKIGARRQAARASAFHFALHTRQKVDCADRVTADPAVVDVLDGKRVDVVPALASPAFYDDQIRALKHAQMLHDGASVQAAKVIAEIPGGSWLIFQEIKDLPSFVIGQRFEDPFLLVGFSLASHRHVINI